MTKLRNTISVVAAFALVLGAFVFAMPKSVDAAAVTVAVSSPANAEFAALTATDVTFGWTVLATDYVAADTITVVVSPALAGALTGCTVPTTTIAGGAGSFGSFTTTGAVYTFSGANSTTAASACLRFPASTVAGSYSISVTDTSNSNNFGAALVYVGDDNDVSVTGVVGPTLSFNIRDLADAADTNICYMGQVDTLSQPNGDATINAGEGECGYSLAIATNAENGATATLHEQARFTTGTHNATEVVEDAAFAAGTEAYGIDDVAAATGMAVGANFDATTPIPDTGAAQTIVSSTDPVLYVAGTDATDVTSVVHGFAVSTSTPTGVYNHVVTYYVTASF